MQTTEALPFNRGETFFGTTTPSDDAESSVHEGKTYWVWDDTYKVPIKIRCVRNTHGAAIEAKRAMIYKTGYTQKRVDGYCHVTADQVAGFSDFAYGSKTIANNDLFWMIVGGLAVGLTDIAASAANLLPEWSNIVGLTAATSGATTAGRISVADLTGATAVLADQILNNLGRNMTARTTANTNSDILISLRESGLV